VILVYIAFGILLFCLTAYYVVPWLIGKYLRHLLRIKARASRSVCLTFDDGPGSRLTLEVLNILAENDVKATFFLLGTNIAGREEIVRQIAEQGHQICSHGHEHLHYWKVSPLRAISDIKQGWNAIDKALGRNEGIYPFRPPYGKLNLFCLLYLCFKKVPIFYWTLVSGDTWPVDKQDSHRVSSIVNKTKGEVVLAHDFDRRNERINNIVLDSLRLTLSMAEKNGMQVTTLSVLMGS
jgi:peptidoglycan/xylan/chitin deacetylase (PgdA/CDA1 family)